jgi:hypothetical protein
MKGPIRELAPKLANRRANKREIAVLDAFAKHAICVTWDFSEDGGAVGDIEFDTQIPAGAIVTDVWSDVVTAATSGGAADYKIQAGSTDLVASTDFDDAGSGIDATGVDKLTLDGSAEGIKVSAASELKFVIETAALTAGKVRFCIEFLAPEQL